MERTKLQRVKDYREAKALNQSYLKSLFNPYKKVDWQQVHKSKFTKGNLVDVLVTMEEHFDDFFYLSKLEEKPSENIMKIVEYAHESFNYDEEEPKLIELSDFIIEGANKYEYGQSWKEVTLLNRVVKEGNNYYQELLVAGEREVIIQSELDLAKTLVTTLYTHELTAPLFEKSTLEFQKDIYWKFEVEEYPRTIPCKGLLDIADITDETIRVIDIKCTDISPWEVDRIIKRLRYDFQVTFYSEGLKDEYPNHDLLMPRIIFVHNNFPDTVTVVELSEKDYNTALNGAYFTRETFVDEDTNVTIKEEREIPGILDALELHIHPRTNNQVQISNIW